MQYKVPQNIDMEDKIIGPLTLWQFLYLLFGGLLDYILYQTIHATSPVAFWFLALPVALIALGLAFVKIHDRPLGTFIRHAISFALSPRERVWQKQESLEGTSTVNGQTPQAKPSGPLPPVKQLPPADLENLSRILDTYGEPAATRPGQQNTNPPGAVPDGQRQK